MATTRHTTGRLQGKVAVVTGAAQGMGRAVVEAFVNEGATVIATDLAQQRHKLESLTSNFPDSVQIFSVDVADKKTIADVAAKVDKCDVLFNCAGIVQSDTVLDMTDDNWDKVMNVNIKGTFWMTQAFLPKMIESKKGCIINMSSMCSSVKGFPNRASYGISKAAVIGLTKSVASDYAHYGIRCNCICPGTVETESWRERVASAPDGDKARRDFINRQPMGRIGRPEEIASLVVYLASDDGAFATGSEFVVDGGSTGIHVNN